MEFLIKILLCLFLITLHVDKITTIQQYGYINNQGNCVCPSQMFPWPSVRPSHSRMQSHVVSSIHPSQAYFPRNVSSHMWMHPNQSMSRNHSMRMPRNGSMFMNQSAASGSMMRIKSSPLPSPRMSSNLHMSSSPSMQISHQNMSLAINSSIMMGNYSLWMNNMNASHYVGNTSFHLHSMNGSLHPSSMMYSHHANMSESPRKCICSHMQLSIATSIAPSKHMSSSYLPSSSIGLDLTFKTYTMLNNETGVILSQALTMNLAITAVSRDGLMIQNKGGNWKPLPKVSVQNAAVILKTDYLKFVHPKGDTEFYGAVFINFTLTAEVKASIDVSGTAGRNTIILLVLPKTPVPVFDTNLTSIRLTVKEDSKCHVFKIHTKSAELETPIMPTQMIDNDMLKNIPNIDQAVAAEFKNSLKSYFKKQLDEGYAVTSLTRGNGRWLYAPDGKTDETKAFPSEFKTKVFKKSDFNFCFTPPKNYFGAVKMVVQPAFVETSDGTEYVGKGSLTINIIIEPVNDRPTQGSSPFIKVPDLPYNKTNVEPNGFIVSSIMNQRDKRGVSRPAFKDEDGDTLGIGIVSAIETTYGYWEYKCAGTQQWIKLNISYAPPLQVVERLEMVLLTPNDYLRFTLNGSKYWKVVDAQQKKISFQAVAWDQTNNQSCGSFTFDNSTQTWSEAFSARESIVTALQLRIGCNGKPGTDAVVDQCGVCGGDNTKCKGCDGVVNSNATIDSCGKCTGGTTGLKRNYLRDCYKQCGLYFKDNCEVCQRIGKARNYTDCAGQCHGKAKINKCGVCVGGSTKKLLSHGMDACGVCGGDNSTCLDCDGVPNGGKNIDLCGSCLLPTSATFNSACSKLGKFSPTIVYDDQPNVKIELVASGLQRVKSVTCNFVTTTGTSTAAVSSKIQSGSISIMMPSLTGMKGYEIECSLDGNAAMKAVGELKVINNTAVIATTAQPDVVLHNETATVNISGQNFVNSTDLKCLFVYKSSKMVELAAEFVSATAVTCDVLPVMRSGSGKLVLSFVDYKRKDYQQVNVDFHRSVNVPTIESGSFSKNLGALLVKFSHRIQLNDKTSTCEDLFPNNHISFGTKAKCKAAGIYLQIKMIGTPTFSPGLIQMNMTKIKYAGADYTVYPFQMESVIIPAPVNATPPTFDFIAVNKIGVCDSLQAKVRVRAGAGGRKMTYTWKAGWSAANNGNPSTDQKYDMRLFNTSLGQLPAAKSKVHLEPSQLRFFLQSYIELNVTATNFLQQSTEKSTIIYRENKNLPSLRLSTNKVEAEVSDKIKVRAIVELSSCISSSAVTYLWTLYNEDGTGTVDVAYSDTFPTLVITKGLKGGKKYRATVIVAMQSDSSLSSEASVDIEVKSSEPIAVISGPQTVGSTGMMTLSAKYSFDPDEVNFPAAQYMWKISDSTGASVVKNGKAIIDSLVVDTVMLNINASEYLTSGETYMIDLEYRIGIRVGMDRTHVKIISGKPPVILPRLIRGAVNPSRRVVLAINIKSESKVSSVAWSSLDGVEGTVRGGNRVSLYIIDKDVLAGGTEYTFTVTAANVDSTAETNFTISTNSKPTAGIIEVTNSSGLALKTPFGWSASEGWTDPEGSDLTFVFGFMEDGKENDLTQRISSTSINNALLPSGNLTIYIKCFDRFGAYSKSEATVVVTDVIITDAVFANFADENKKSIESGNFDKFFGRTLAVMGQLLKAKQSFKRRRRRSLSNSNHCDSLAQATIDYQVNSADLALQIYENGALQDDAAVAIFLSTLAGVSNCGSVIFDGATITRVYKAVSAVLQPLEKKTATEVESDLITFDNIIDPARYDDSTQQNSKAAYRSTVARQAQRMCLNILTGELAVTAKRSLVVLQAVKLTLDNSDTNFTSLGCPSNSCPNNLQAADYVRLGASLKASFGSSYTCGTAECIGACVTSSQYINDIFSPSLNSSIMSSVLDIKLWDPENSLSLNVTEIPSGMEVKMVATKSTNQSYNCLRWDDATSSWTSDGVKTLTFDSFVLNGANYVSCNVTKLGPLALFEGNKTEPNITITTTMSTTLAPDDYPRNVTFKFPLSNCSDFLNVTANNMTQLENSIRSQIANAINVSADSIANLSLSCGSLVVSYIQVHSSVTTAKAAVSALQAVISSNQLNITLNGQQLSASPESLVVVILPPPYAPTSDTPPVHDNDALSGGAIAGIVVGVVLLIVIIIVVAYIFLGKKKTKKDPTVEPNENDVELRGKTNQGYYSSP